MNVSNVAYSTVNFIVKEVFSSYEKGVEFTMKKIENKLHEVGVDEEKIKRLMEDAQQFDPFEKAKEELEKEINA